MKVWDFSTFTLHDICDNRLGEGLAAAWLPDDEERDPQLYHDGHHPNILLQKYYGIC